MAPDGVVEAVDPAADGGVAWDRVEDGSLAHLGRQRFGEAFDGRVVEAAPLAGHGRSDAMLAQFATVGHRAALRAAVSAVDEPRRRLAYGDRAPWGRQR